MGSQISRRGFIAAAAGIAALAGTACATNGGGSVSGSGSASGLGADSSARVFDTFDLHCDTIDILGMAKHKPYSEFDNKCVGTLSSNNAQVSADRMGPARWVQCYAIWIPNTAGEDATDVKPIDWYREAALWFKKQMEECADRFTQVRDFSEISAILDEGKVPAILTVENASCLEEGVGIVDEFAKDGVLMASLTFDGKNALGCGVDNADEGLTDLGRQCIAALEDHGITLDVSHLNDKSFWELDALAAKPYIASHSNARAVCKNSRNLTDDMFNAIMQRGGIVGLNFSDGYVQDGGNNYDFEQLAKHIHHWLDLGGEDVIALGSDRDGSWPPHWIADVSSQESLYQRFVDEFSVSTAHKLFFENAMNFFGA
ncbi:MAG: membrane dipeptidase [Coriobacteriales bacterium]|nr:membrane dipeptidase [Coriobacteriales bacterium]